MQIAVAAAHVEARATVHWLAGSSGHVVHVLSLSPESLESRSGGWDPATIDSVRVQRTDDVNDEVTCQWLRSLNLDALLVLGWSQILAAPTLAAAAWVVGTHASPLPRGRGGSPVNWAIINREREWGNTLMRLSPRLDGGDVIGQTLFPLNDQDTVASVYERVELSNLELIQGWLADLEAGRATADPQAASNEAPLRRRCPEDGLINWGRPAADIDALVRATTRPYPGAFCTVHGRRVTVWAGTVTSLDRMDGAPGEVVAFESFDGVRCPVVRCSDQGLLLTCVTSEDGCELPSGFINRGDRLA